MFPASAFAFVDLETFFLAFTLHPANGIGLLLKFGSNFLLIFILQSKAVQFLNDFCKYSFCCRLFSFKTLNAKPRALVALTVLIYLISQS